MREHRTIREEMVGPGQTFTYDVETPGFQNLLITWSNSDDSAAAPTSLLLFPTNCRRQTLVNGNFAGVPPAPAPGFNAYISIGPNMAIPNSIPQLLTVGVITPAGVTVSVRIEGDYVDNILTNPSPTERSRS